MSAERVAAVPPLIKPASPPKFTLEEYFAMDAASECRLEYVNGYVVTKDGVYITDAGQIHTEEMRHVGRDSPSQPYCR